MSIKSFNNVIIMDFDDVVDNSNNEIADISTHTFNT